MNADINPDEKRQQSPDYIARVQIRLVVLDRRGNPVRAIANCWLDYANADLATRAYQWVRKFLVSQKKRGRHTIPDERTEKQGWRRVGKL